MADRAVCGFAWDTASRADVLDIIGSGPERFAAEFSGHDLTTLRRRPAPTTWSALEYTVHTSVALQFYCDRIGHVLNEDEPTLAAYGFGDACDRDRYNEREVEPSLDDKARRAAHEVQHHLLDVRRVLLRAG